MKMIPLLHTNNMKESLNFYTTILDFELKCADASANDWVVDLVNSDAEIQLTNIEGDQKKGIAVNVRVDDVDSLFKKYTARSLNNSNKKDSPVHQGPLNQTWGMREFYVTDPSGNTLRFGKPIA